MRHPKCETNGLGGDKENVSSPSSLFSCKKVIKLLTGSLLEVSGHTILTVSQSETGIFSVHVLVVHHFGEYAHLLSFHLKLDVQMDISLMSVCLVRSESQDVISLA